MNTPANTASRYIAIWNEGDAGARRQLIAAFFTNDASYCDPMMKGDGHAGIDAMIAAAQSQFAGMRFSLAGTPDGYDDVTRFSWSLAVPGEKPVAHGTDICVSNPSGHVAHVTGFLDTAPVQA